MGERVGIVGSRDWPHPARVTAYVATLAADAIVVSGAGGVVDRTAVAAAEERGLCTREYLADWWQYGRRAGPLRNTQLVAGIDRLVAFHDGVSRGTADAIRKARAAGLPVEIITP